MNRIVVIAVSGLVGASIGYLGPKLAGWFRSEPAVTLPFPTLHPYDRVKKGRTPCVSQPSHNAAVYPQDPHSA